LEGEPEYLIQDRKGERDPDLVSRGKQGRGSYEAQAVGAADDTGLLGAQDDHHKAGDMTRRLVPVGHVEQQIRAQDGNEAGFELSDVAEESAAKDEVEVRTVVAAGGTDVMKDMADEAGDSDGREEVGSGNVIAVGVARVGNRGRLEVCHMPEDPAVWVLDGVLDTPPESHMNDCTLAHHKAVPESQLQAEEQAQAGDEDCNGRGEIEPLGGARHWHHHSLDMVVQEEGDDMPHTALGEAGFLGRKLDDLHKALQVAGHTC